MNKEEWKAFLRWLETASAEELERRFLAISMLAQAFKEEGSRAEAGKMLENITLELDARRAIR